MGKQGKQKRKNQGKVLTDDSWGDREGTSSGICNYGRDLLLPLLLVVIFPTLMLAVGCGEGVFVDLFNQVRAAGAVDAPYTVFAWARALWQDCYALIEWRDVEVILYFSIFELALMRLVPGRLWKGPRTSTGHIPEYIDNGMSCHLITLAACAFLHFYQLFDMAQIYERFRPLMVITAILGLGISLVCSIKGVYCPSTKDCGRTASWAMDYYWGTELYPRILGFDIKEFCNCRYGMISWTPLCFAYMAAQYKLEGRIANTMLISCVLQLIYCTKFFHWETGYFNSTDIQTDRGGFYLLYGCCNVVPILYTAHTRELVGNPVDLPQWQAVALFLFGIGMIYVNYWSDEQRWTFRQTQGESKIWGSIPTKIEAKYVTSDGKTHRSLLLTSGFWGLSRHFHYFPEWLAALAWSVPMSTGTYIQYSYLMVLTPLLTDRLYRDDDRCRKKYGKYWGMYCEKVPYRVVPFLF